MPDFLTFIDAPLSATKARITVIEMRAARSLKDVHEMAVDYCRKFWCSEDNSDLDKVRDVVSNFPKVPTFDERIDLQDLKEALRKTKLHKARGPDCWSGWELKHLPEPFQLALASLLNTITETGNWPSLLVQATEAMLSKVEGAFRWSRRGRSQSFH